MKVGMDISVNRIEYVLLFFEEVGCSNAAILIPKHIQGGAPPFMAVKNICNVGDTYRWDDEFYTEDMTKACSLCNAWVKDA